MREQASIPLTFTDDLRPVGDAKINGVAVPAMLSTGAGESFVFNKKILDRLGIEVRNTTSKLDADDTRNPTKVDLYVDFSHASIKDFSIGPAKVKGGTYKVENFMDDTYGVRVGAGMLLQHDLEIALDAGYLKSFNPSGCIGAHLAYWDPQAASVLAMWDPWKRDARVVFTATIGGKPIHALLSTATPYSYVPKAAAVRLGLTPESPGATREAPLPGHAADKPVWKVPVPLLSIGQLEVKDLDLRLMDLSHEGEALVLGADFLHRHRVYVAMEQKRIYFSPITRPQTRKRGSVEVIPQPLN
ncbi:pepsin/retropepsin-like aspartic protease family protein [Massilia sp. BSC265]|uniref:pepsin/retropepsin-like aspartic protease family protein n=1 Tax=Massilia sp. BSC265 TaxID=1549812 RepID=UPI0004E8647E|nr:pepsin/retropepsin-like aspartic protease family protein [Massilia sp. BSC265]KFI06200.1 hypothetical protein JN27_19085 [Massilia sp. BSC265]